MRYILMKNPPFVIRQLGDFSLSCIQMGEWHAQLGKGFIYHKVISTSALLHLFLVEGNSLHRFS